MNFYNTLTTAASWWPTKLAIADPWGDMTFGELLLETNILKQQLLDSGVRGGNGVGIHVHNNRYFIITLYAVLACDATAMPIGYQQTADEITEATQEANLHFIVSDNPPAITGHTSVETFSYSQLALRKTARSTGQPAVDFVPDAAVMRFTSGTTGTAKCVILSHEAIWQRTLVANEGLNLTENDRVIWVLPMAYHFIVSIMLYIRHGVGIVVCNDFLAAAILAGANAYNATVLYAAPIHFQLLANNKNSTRFSTLKAAVSTTTSINRSTCYTFYQRYGVPVTQAFGIIELGLPIMNGRDSETHPESVGRPLPSFRIAILDEFFMPLPPGKTGLLAIRGPGMFDGYLKPPTPASTLLRNGMFVTGDYAEQTDNGLIIIRGRATSMINVAGNKVFPDEVESVLMQHPQVQQARVFGQLHPLLGEVVSAELVTREGDNFDAEEIINHCRKHLSSFKVPQHVQRVSEIQMTGSGKIKRT
jgi:acyl-coenzyme A synthetase/AMP-(fatty) acid ligase